MKKILIGASLFISFSLLGSQEMNAQTTTKSRAGKNAIIGAGAGAVTGAVVSKNHRGKGALIGGAVGAAGGYAWGKHQDKKKGRKVVYKKRS
ncbi:MAG: glycine zipper domain-containing protein [Ferruginibacter sp.]